MIPDYTVVLGVDEGHLDHFKTVIPNWVRHKRRTFERRPLVVFVDCNGNPWMIHEVLRVLSEHPIFGNTVVREWPTSSLIQYQDDESAGRFGKAQRAKMLAGFVHIPARFVGTPYWLKLDLDAVASGQEDWIDPAWFEKNPSIIASAWSYTKPPDQMVRLDEWASGLEVKELQETQPLNLIPQPGASSLPHQRIISWCAFFNTEFTKKCSELAPSQYHLPVPSQDGYMWYLAKRLGTEIVTTRMKMRGWIHCANLASAKTNIAALSGGPA